jgi:hypothetical protein
MSELATALLTGDLTQLENLIRQAAEQTGVDRIENMLQIGFFSRRTLEQMDAEGAASQLEELMQRLVGQGLSERCKRRCGRRFGSSPSGSSRSRTTTTSRSFGARRCSRRASTTSPRRTSAACARW